MGKYYKCKCGNREVGDSIKQCDKCSKIYCSSCAYNSDVLHLFDVCPKCKHYGYEILGWIEKPTSNKFNKKSSRYSPYSDSNSSGSTYEDYSSAQNFSRRKVNPIIVISLVLFILSFVIFMDSYDYFEERRVRFMKWVEDLSPSSVLRLRVLSLITMIGSMAIAFRSWYGKK